MTSSPTPITANGRLLLSYTLNGLAHKTEVRCSINNPAGPSPYLLDQILGGTVDAHAAAAQYDALISPYYNTATVFGAWTLYLRSGTLYVPLDSWASTAVGTGTSGALDGAQLTWFFRDPNQKPLKIIWIEGDFAVPQKILAFTSGPGKNFVDSMLSPASGNLGSWVRARNNTPPGRFVSYVTSLNRKIRRLRGVA